MRPDNQRGVTLIELMATISILAIITGAAIPLLSSSLDAHNHGIERSRLHHEGLLAMETMTSRVKRSTFLLIPNAHNTTRDILAISGFINDDNDYYFNDPLFPRYDEDFSHDMNGDGQHGIAGYDDDGDGDIDEWAEWGNGGDDDEDTIVHLKVNDDPLDGKDNDGDGNIDEDCDGDANGDGAPGIAGMDDDGDGTVDEGDIGDDDEDGTSAEAGLIPEIYYWDTGTNELVKHVPFTNSTRTLASHVSHFQVDYETPDATHGPRIQIALTLTGDDGESIQFLEYVYPRNILQKTGKRVR